jgi:hypothetical protein
LSFSYVPLDVDSAYCDCAPGKLNFLQISVCGEQLCGLRGTRG